MPLVPVSKPVSSRLKQEPLRTGRAKSSRAPPANCGRRLPPFLSSSPGRSSQSRKTALRPSRAEGLDRLSRFQLHRFEHGWHHDLGRFVHAKVENRCQYKQQRQQRCSKAAKDVGPRVIWPTQPLGVLISKGLYPGHVQTTISVWSHHASLNLFCVSLLGINHPTV